MLIKSCGKARWRLMSKHRNLGILAAVAVAVMPLAGVTAKGIGIQPARAAQLSASVREATSGWRVISVVGPLHGVTSMRNLAVPGPGDAWSTWTVCSPCGSTTVAAFRIERWNGSAWHVVKVPTRLGRYATNSAGLGASSRRDAWLFNAGALARKALHWNGTRWAVRTIPSWVVRSNLSG